MGSDWAAIIANVLAGTAVAVSLYGVFRPRPRAEIRYNVRTVQSLINDVAGVNLHTTVDGVPVASGFTAEIRIANTGRTALAREDFASPLVVELAASTKLLAAHQVGASPAGSRAKLTLIDGHLEIDPGLLNARDLIVVQLVGDGFDRTIKVQARVRQMRKLRRRSTPYEPGTGEDGKLLLGDHFFTSFLFPIMGLGLVLLSLTQVGSFTQRVAFAVTVGLVFLVLYPLWLISRVRISRLWRPEEKINP